MTLVSSVREELLYFSVTCCVSEARWRFRGARTTFSSPLVGGLLSCKGFRGLRGRVVAEVEGRETSGGGRAGGKFCEG